MYNVGMVTKEALRIASMKRRSQLSPAQRKLASLQICQELFRLIEWSNIQRLNSYKALDSLHEADPKSLLIRLSKDFPNVEIVVSPFKLDAAHPDGEFDAIIVPLVAFDAECNRIGMGGGWYDAYFAAHPNSLKIGIAYSIQEVPVVPVTPLDVPLDIVVTENKIFKR